MNVLLLSTQDAHGAGTSALRLHQGMGEVGIRSKLLVQEKHSHCHNIYSLQGGLRNISIKVKRRMDLLPLLLEKTTDKNFSVQWLQNIRKHEVDFFDPDIINLHWICKSFVSIEMLKNLSVPIVWTLHDMWPFTGGCHYSHDCDRYMQSCGRCPKLTSNKEADISRWIWNRKLNSWKNIEMTIVTPSKWLEKCARASSLFRERRIETIPYGLDLDIYRPIDKTMARSLLNLPLDKKIVLFGATVLSDERKGWHFLQLALESIASTCLAGNISLLTFGSYAREDQKINLETYELGKLHDDATLALAYSAADVFVAPSVQDNLPNTVLEAISCGTPCVAFHIGGMSDMIDHQKNGYLSMPFDYEDLAQGIVWILEDENRYEKLRHQAREKAEAEFSLNYQAARYSRLFCELTGK